MADEYLAALLLDDRVSLVATVQADQQEPEPQEVLQQQQQQMAPDLADDLSQLVESDNVIHEAVEDAITEPPRKLKARRSFLCKEGFETHAACPGQLLNAIKAQVLSICPERPLTYASDCSGGDAPWQAWKLVQAEVNEIGIPLDMCNEFWSEGPDAWHAAKFLMLNHPEAKRGYQDIHERRFHDPSGGPCFDKSSLLGNGPETWEVDETLPRKTRWTFIGLALSATTYRQRTVTIGRSNWIGIARTIRRAGDLPGHCCKVCALFGR